MRPRDQKSFSIGAEGVAEYVPNVNLATDRIYGSVSV